MKTRRVVLGVSGSIAAYKAADIIRRLQDKNCAVRVVMTACAEKFITPLTLETLSQHPVARGVFDRDSGRATGDMAHISLAEWAEVFVVAPATANVIGKMAHGLADDLVSCTAVTTRAPIVIAPAMNTGMWTNALVQENVAKLKKYGVAFIEPKKAKLACGSVGDGALADVDKIVDSIIALLK